MSYKQPVINYLNFIIETKSDEEKLSALSLTATAKCLKTSRRSLERYLKNENTSFRKLLDDVRKEHSEKLINTMLVKDVAKYLGYKSHNCYSKRYKNWFGKSPSYAKYLHRINVYARALNKQNNGVI